MCLCVDFLIFKEFLHISDACRKNAAFQISLQKSVAYLGPGNEQSKDQTNNTTYSTFEK